MYIKIVSIKPLGNNKKVTLKTQEGLKSFVVSPEFIRDSFLLVEEVGQNGYSISVRLPSGVVIRIDASEYSGGF
jgi:hypothetical protein